MHIDLDNSERARVRERPILLEEKHEHFVAHWENEKW